MYQVSKYIDSIKKVDKVRKLTPLEQEIYIYFETFQEAKDYCVKRAEAKILQLEKEVYKVEKKLLKLKKLTDN